MLEICVLFFATYLDCVIFRCCDYKRKCYLSKYRSSVTVYRNWSLLQPIGHLMSRLCHRAAITRNFWIV